MKPHSTATSLGVDVRTVRRYASPKKCSCQGPSSSDSTSGAPSPPNRLAEAEASDRNQVSGAASSGGAMSLRESTSASSRKKLFPADRCTAAAAGGVSKLGSGGSTNGRRWTASKHPLRRPAGSGSRSGSEIVMNQGRGFLVIARIDCKGDTARRDQLEPRPNFARCAVVGGAAAEPLSSH